VTKAAYVGKGQGKEWNMKNKIKAKQD